MKKTVFCIFFLCHLGANSQINLEIGEKAPEIKITNWLKNTPENKSLEGKFIVLEFWATWCAPCLKAVPHLNDLKNKYKNVFFLSITDEKQDKVLKQLSKINFETIVVSDTSKVTFENYKSIEFNDVLRPSTILIDDKGIIKWVGYPEILDEKIIDKFLTNKLKPYNYFTTSQFKKDLEDNNSGNIKDFKLRLQSELNDDKLNEFIFVEKSNKQYGLNGFIDDKNKAMMIAHKDFKFIYSKLTQKPTNEFIINESIAKDVYNFCMIHKTNNVESLDKMLLEKLKLKKEVFSKETDFYDISTDFKKLGSGKLEEFKGKYAEDDENGEFKFFNYQIIELITLLNQTFSLTLSTKINNSKVYNFTIQYNSKEEIFKSLEDHGFKFSVYKKNIEIFKIDPI